MGSINTMINRFLAFTLKRALFAKIYLNLMTSKKNKRILLLGTEDFGNLGDHHIAYSQIQFFKYHFPEYSIVELPASVYYQKIGAVAKFIQADDLIILPGGGNMGDAYPFSEKLRYDAIERFPEQSKIIFPQTIYYEKEENLFNALAKYTSANKVMIFCREKQSFAYAQQNFDCQLYLSPDIVLFSRWNYRQSRKGILACLRNDKERNQKLDKAKLLSAAGRVKKQVDVTDTQLNYNVSVLKRKRYLQRFLKLMSGYELVITDRLHGMIFSAISNTPCIVLPNYNHKVKGVHSWISNCRSISFMEADNNNIYQELTNTIEKMLLEKSDFDKIEELVPEFNKMAERISSFCSGDHMGDKNAG